MSRIHLLSVAGSDRDLPRQLGLEAPGQIVGFVQDAVGPAFQVTTNQELMTAAINERRGGRHDDELRVLELSRCFADDSIAALVALRGGAWLTRILEGIDFAGLERRRRPLCLFGFSELTTLVNIAGAFSQVRAFYDLGPGYLLTSLREQPAGEADDRTSHATPAHDTDGEPDSSRFTACFAGAFQEFFADVAMMVSTGRSGRRLRGELLAGDLPPETELHVVGGCLSVLVALCGTPFQRCIDTAGKWLALEDVREEVYRLDRYLAQLKLCGLLDGCAGILLGDFHNGETSDQTADVLELLRIHLPRGRSIPVIGNCNFGHRQGVAPLPIHQPVLARSEPAGQRRGVLLEPRGDCRHHASPSS